MVVDIESHTCPCRGNALHRIGEDTGGRAEAASISRSCCKLSRHRAVRRLCSLQEIAGGQDHSRLLLEPLAARILQDRRARRCAPIATEAVARIAQIYAIEKDARHKCRSAPCRAPDKIAPTHQRAQDLLRASAHAALGRIGYRQDHPLRPLARSTLADWVGRAAFLLRPVHERLLMALKDDVETFEPRPNCLPMKPRPGARSRPGTHQTAGALFYGRGDTTCGNWTKSGDGSAIMAITTVPASKKRGT